MNPYRTSTEAAMRQLLEPRGPFSRALDFGSGDGWLAHAWRGHGLARAVTPVDVMRRRASLVEPILYDGRRLPFADRCFDLVWAVDVVHHCPEPRAALGELARCAGDYLLLKDHTYRTPAGWLTLCLFDESGNRLAGVASPHKYQKGWAWLPWIEELGFELQELIHPAPCEPRAHLAWFANPLHFIGLWRRAS